MDAADKGIVKPLARLAEAETPAHDGIAVYGAQALRRSDGAAIDESGGDAQSLVKAEAAHAAHRIIGLCVIAASLVAEVPDVRPPR